MPLDVAKLLSADRTHIIGALPAIANKAPSDWLSVGHPGPNGQLPTTWNALTAWSDAQRIEAVAFAGPTHCIDGWGYASRALSAMLAGDFHAARHLAYYAQLRAGLSLLAGLGVGVFNGINFSVRGDGTTERVDPTSSPSRHGLGTHVMVWEALEAWISNTASSSALLSLMRIRNSTIHQALEDIFPGFNSQSAAAELVTAWGLDLRRGKREHVYRKVSSYVPHAFNDLNCGTPASLGLIEEVWQMFEPSAGPGFDSLDRHLLRAALHRHQKNVDPSVTPDQGAISSRYEQLSDDVRAIASRDFLLGFDEPEEPLLVRLARSDSDPAEPHEMIARSLLLLRASLAVTYSNLSDAGVASSAALRPWLDSLALQRGFFSNPGSVEHMADLWSDVELALEEMSAAADPEPIHLHDWTSRAPVGFPTIAEAERIGLWSLCA